MESPGHGGSNPVDLRQVHYFLAVTEELNFSRAAERLHISPPSLSQQIKALERFVGAELLIRDTRRVRLTAAGEVFAVSSRQLLHQAASAVDEARDAAGSNPGHLVLAALLDAESAFEPFLTECRATFPDLQVQIAAMRHADLIASLFERRVDAVLTWSYLLDRSTDSDGLRSIGVAATEVFAALAPQHPLAAHASVTRGQALRGTSVTLFERGYSPASFDYTIEELYGSGYVDPPVREVNVNVRAQETMARQIGVEGGLTALSQPVADLFRGTCEIRPFDPPWFLEGRVVWRNGDMSSALMNFVAAASAVSRIRLAVPRPRDPEAPRRSGVNHTARLGPSFSTTGPEH
ncbi:LysR family transcriptional regulator [Nocardioides sp. HB32]